MRKRWKLGTYLDLQKSVAALEVKIAELEARMTLRIDHVAEQAKHNASIIQDLNVVKHTVAGIKEQLETEGANKRADRKARLQSIITAVLALITGIALDWLAHRFFS